ncbi:hypothetical protein GEV27_05380 [Aeromicrobium sp. S22]|uniref:hypothetical protein n=1 Tax=Aeromicrobium sp. S22 TaxID=2662029 RepID=UPI00129EAC62|nr:hypothetical protein [Aeromicrobium sp. S22]MRK00949.1 hypothetical protein [Aeromicrobium sp. S22]
MYQEVTGWDDSEENLERFAAGFGVRDYRETGILTNAVLVRHKHNRYNRNAISVSRPATAGGSLKKRHLGYLSERFLKWAGQDTLPALIDHAGGEVEVAVIVVSPDTLLIDIPKGQVVGAAVRAFLEPRGVKVSGGPSWEVPTPPTLRTHAGNSPDTARTLELITADRKPRVLFTDVQIDAARSYDHDARVLRILDRQTASYLGSVTEGVLEPVDERDREDLLVLLEEQDIRVRQPVTDPIFAEDGTWPVDVVPNAWVRKRAESLDLRAHDPENPNSQESFAVYNPTLDILWVEDSRLVAPALRCFHRMGIDPAQVGLPERSWGLDHEISWSSLRAPTRRGQDGIYVSKPRLFDDLAQILPDGLLTGDVTWLAEPLQLTEPDPDFLRLEEFVAARTDLFPEHAFTGIIEPCRLCGYHAATFTTPISTRELTYCHVCLSAAATGLVEDRARAATALKAISDLEFDSQPMLEAQLVTLHVNPEDPVEPAIIDQLLLLRFAIGRKRIAWTLLLEAAGFAEGGLRTSRGTLIRSRDGHLCYSMREKAVCDFLHQHGIAHDREPLYPQDQDFNPTGLRRADWILPDGTLVELWGLPNDPAYAAKMEAKRLLAVRHGLRLIEILDRDLPNLPAIFGSWISPRVRTGWTWSPLLIATAEAAAKPPPEVMGDNRGRNDFNTAARRERLERCALVVRLQADGLTRAEIGQAISTSAEVVKGLLRDGKFYADPASDPPRHQSAKQASAARERQETRAQFQAAHSLTTPKAAEAWRDAGVLFET